MSHGLKNKLVYASIFFIFAVIIEMITFLYTDGVVFAKYVGLDIAVLSFISVLIIVSVHDKAAISISLIFLGFQIILSYTNVNLLKITGEVFSWDMIKIVGEALQATGVGITITFNYLLVTIPLYALAFYIYLKYYKHFKNRNYHFTVRKFSGYSLVAVLLSCFGVGVYQLSVINIQRTVDSSSNTHSSLSDSFLFNTFFIKQEALQKFGTYGYYFLSSFNFKASIPMSEIEKEYETYSVAHESNAFTGISKGNNVIMILFETGDIAAINKDLTPNLYNLATSSLYLSGYHAKDQTNISEAKFLFGSYPISNTLNAAYEDNIYPFTLPNMYRTIYPDSQVMSFHGNDGAFYKRAQAHERYGFSYHVDLKDAKIGPFDTWITPDSVYFDAVLSTRSNTSTYNMIPEDTSKRFFSYVATFSTHGPFYSSPSQDRRNEYKVYSDRINEYLEAGNVIKTFNGEIVDITDEKQLTYMCGAMDLDLAIGYMMDDLRSKDLLKNTTIMMLTDHYAYYNDLAKTIRGISDDSDISLYNVPGFIYDEKLIKAVKNNESIWTKYNFCYKTFNDDYNTRVLCMDKFTANFDCTPTILNLLGYKYNEADYLGNDMFDPNKESFIISRWGGIFNKNCYTTDGSTILNMPSFQQAEETGLLPAGYTFEEYYRDLAIADLYRENVSDFIAKYTFIDKLYETNYYKDHSLVKY